MTNVWHHWPGIDEDVAAIFDPFGNAVHTALAFPVLGEDVLITRRRADRPDGDRGRRSHAGARFVVVSEPNPVRRALAERMGATRRRRPAGARPRRRPARSWAWSRASTSRSRCRATRRRCATAIDNMAHGGGIAILGIPTEEITLDVNEIVFKLLTIRGIYGREMYETWYKMTVMLQSGLDITPAITHRFAFRDHEAAFATARSGDSGKVILDWIARRDATRGGRTMTAARPNPLAFLDDELAALRERHLYRPLRVMSSRPGPDRLDRRPARDQPLVQRLPGPDPPPADEAARRSRRSSSSARAPARCGRSPGR